MSPVIAVMITGSPHGEPVISIVSWEKNEINYYSLRGSVTGCWGSLRTGGPSIFGNTSCGAIACSLSNVADASATGAPFSCVLAGGGTNLTSTIIPRSTWAKIDSKAQDKSERCSFGRSGFPSSWTSSFTFVSIAAAILSVIFLSNTSLASFSVRTSVLLVSARTLRISSTCFHVLSAHVTAAPSAAIVIGSM
jgi:hypothetical protein